MGTSNALPRWTKSRNGRYVLTAAVDDDAARRAAIRRLEADGALAAARRLKRSLSSVADAKRGLAQ